MLYVANERATSVAHVLRDYGLHVRAQAPADSQAVHPPRKDPGA